MKPPNPALREHVTSTAFNLTLSKTHITALVWVDYHIRTNEYTRATGNPWNLFATGCDGLKRRGLITHHYAGRDKPFSANYTITPAGQAVIVLLKEAGIWQEWEAKLLAARRKASA